MLNQFRFGRISVVCEGYDYPEDPYVCFSIGLYVISNFRSLFSSYVLKGSCGLEFELEYNRNYDEKSYNNRGNHKKSYKHSFLIRYRFQA